MRVGLFVDVANLYHRSKEEYDRKLNYKAYLDFVKLMGDVTVARAYGSYAGDSAKPFIGALKNIGYTPIFKETKIRRSKGKDYSKGNLDGIMMVDIMESLLRDEFDKLVLGSADSDFMPVVRKCIDHGKQVVVLACKVSKSYHSVAEVMEINLSMMEEQKDEATEPR